MQSVGADLKLSPRGTVSKISPQGMANTGTDSKFSPRAMGSTGADFKLSPKGMANTGTDSKLSPRGTVVVGTDSQVSPRGLTENVRRPLETLKQNVIATGRRQSCLDSDVEKSDDRRFRVVLQEKDKQLMFLEQQLLITQARVEELQAGSDKFKRQEREAKKTLSSKESDLRRQTVALKQTNDKEC